jgi:hypothetical protein
MTSRVGWSAGEDGLTGGAHVSAAGGERAGTNSGLGDVGPWASSSVGPNRFPGPFSDFFISFRIYFPVLSFSFISFANLLQINSKLFLNSSNNTSNVLNQ